MFSFEKLAVYDQAKKYHSRVKNEVMKNGKLEKTYLWQLRRASLSVVLNIDEGSSRFTGPSARNFYVISRGSLFETVAILDVLRDEKLISKDLFDSFYNDATEISYALYQMIRSLEHRN